MAFEGINNVIRCFLQREANATIKLFMLPKSFKIKYTGLGLNMKVWRIWLFLCCLIRQVIHLLVYYKPSGLSGAPERVQWPEHVYASFISKSSLQYNNVLQKEVPNSVTCHLTGKKIKEKRGSTGRWGKQWGDKEWLKRPVCGHYQILSEKEGRNSCLQQEISQSWWLDFEFVTSRTVRNIN